MQKRKLILPAVLVTAAALSLGGAYALFTSTTSQTNKIYVKDQNSEIEETFVPVKLVMGDNKLTKKVSVKNTEGVDCFVRVALDFGDSETEKSCLFSSDGKAYYSASPDGGFDDWSEYVNNTYNNKDLSPSEESYTKHLPDGWVYISEADNADLGGYYYYTKPLKEGESTSDLLDSVVLCRAADSYEWNNYIWHHDTDIHVYEESVQAKGLTADSADDTDYKTQWTRYLTGSDPAA